MRFPCGHPSASRPRPVLIALAALALLATGGGCESTLSNDVFSADIAYLNAVPRRAVLHLASTPSPEADTATSSALETASNALGAGTAELWRMTRTVTWQIDHRNLRRPARARGRDGHGADGPRRHPPDLGAVPGCPVAGGGPPRRHPPRHRPLRVRLRTADPRGRIHCAGQRHLATHAGCVRVRHDSVRLRGGGGRGRVDVAFERHAGGVDFTLDLDGLVDETTGEPMHTRYEARRDETGAGELTFTSDAAGERWAMRSQWRADGSGRADARVVGAEGAEGAIVRECWDTAFERVFAESPEGSVGDPEACVFEPAEPPASERPAPCAGVDRPHRPCHLVPANPGRHTRCVHWTAVLRALAAGPVLAYAPVFPLSQNASHARAKPNARPPPAARPPRGAGPADRGRRPARPPSPSCPGRRCSRGSPSGQYLNSVEAAARRSGPAGAAARARHQPLSLLQHRRRQHDGLRARRAAVRGGRRAADARGLRRRCAPRGAGRLPARRAGRRLRQRLHRHASGAAPIAARSAPDEQARWLGIAGELANGDAWQGLRFAVSGMIQSPHFLYRVELGEPDPPTPTAAATPATRWRAGCRS
jgi:hypothetical protein